MDRLTPARRALSALAAAALLAPTAAGCSNQSSNDDPTIVVGYQSKTIDTVNAGTLLRSLGYFEQQLNALSKTTGKHYRVVWQDYATGAPITTQMIAGKTDIGSMGDYPLLINGSTAQKQARTATEMIATTGYNLRGALNQIVVAPDSTATSLRDLAGKPVSTSVGSAADGTLVQALQRAGLDPAGGVHVVNQQPAVGASALQAGSIAALSQFIAWPGQLVFAGQAKMLYDGGALNVPTLHGVVVRTAFADANPGVVNAFLKAEIQATQYIWQHPLQAAETVASATGLAPEVVYLYNGPDGLVTFDPTLKGPEEDAMRGDVPFLKSIGVLNSIDLSKFIKPDFVEQVYGSGYASAAASTANPSRISGTDPICGGPVGDPATASEVWFSGEQSTQPAATPTCLLRAVRAATAAGKKVRAAYVPSADIGTRWFADKDVWVLDTSAAATSRLLPFTTPAAASSYTTAHPGTSVVSYATALADA